MHIGGRVKVAGHILLLLAVVIKYNYTIQSSPSMARQCNRVKKGVRKERTANKYNNGRDSTRERGKG